MATTYILVGMTQKEREKGANSKIYNISSLPFADIKYPTVAPPYSY